MKPEVSVIVPAYNTEAYIAQAIESALEQTLNNIEVIVVDDASTDDTAKIAKSFTDKRLKVLVNEKNLGVSGTRNRALKEAQGKWIAVLDSDDWYAPERLEKLLQIAEAEDADMVAEDLYLIQNNAELPWSTLLNESGEEIIAVKQIDPIYVVETGIYGETGLHLGLSKPLFKKEFLIKYGIEYDETFPVIEDLYLLIQCLVNGARFIFLPKPYYFYRSRPGSLVTKSKVSHINEFIEVITKLLNQKSVQNNTKLVASLYKSLAVLKKYKAYYSVVEPLKQKKILISLNQIIRNPYFFIHFMKQLSAILKRRFNYYILGNKYAFSMLYRIK